MKHGATRAWLACALMAAPAWAAAAPAPAQGRTAALRGATVRDANALAIDELLRSARLWQALEVATDERAELLKILAIEADEPRALFLLGQLALQAGDAQQAQQRLQQLRQRAGSSAAAAELQALTQVYTSGRQHLAQLRQALRGHDTARALALARQLFPDGRPPGSLANEFAPLLSQTPQAWETLRALFAQRIAQDPNAIDRLSLYELLAQRASTRAQALRGYAALAQTADAPPERVAQGWRRAVLGLAANAQAVAEQRRFLRRFPGDAPVAAALAANQALIGAPRAPGEDPAAARLREDAVRALDAGDLAAAESLLSRSLALQPEDGETLGSLGLLRLRQGRDDEALAQFEAALRREPVGAGTRARWSDLADTARYWAGLRAARARRDAGDLEGAVDLVLAVRAIQPRQTEANLLLAELRALQGRDAQADALFADVLAHAPADARAWRGRLALQLRQGAVDLALDRAQGLDQRGMLPAAAALDVTALRAAIAAGATQHPDSALRRLERAVRLLPHEAWLRYDLAQEYRRLELPELARQVMREGLALDPHDAATAYATALVEAATDAPDAALATLDAIDPAARSDGMRELAQRLRFEGALARARAARSAGQVAEDARWRAQALAEAGADPARRLRVAHADLYADDRPAALTLLLALRAERAALSGAQDEDLAEALIDAGQPDAALAELDAAVQPAPDAARRAVLRARAHAAQQDRPALRADVASLQALLPPDDVAMHLQVLRLLDDERTLARPWIEALLARHPQDAPVLLEAARQAERDADYVRALDLLQAVLALPPPAATSAAPLPGIPLLALAPLDPAAPPSPPPGQDDAWTRARARQQAIEARRQPHVDVAVLHYQRSADEGISSLRGTEIPLLAVWPSGYSGHWFAQIDALHLDAGELPAGPGAAAQLGTVQALAPQQGLVRPVDERAAGLSLAGGWRGDDRRIDLGLVGAGFAVPNLVGGWRESSRWGDTDLSAEVSRRVQTGSLLAYAGMVDPVTGSAWGGVTNTALKLRAGRDSGGPWSTSTALTLGVLSGRQVANNPMLQWRSLVERAAIRQTDWRLTVGGLLNVWHYARNESFYTFGQGGYYSPQRYLSLGLPVELTGRLGALSYDVRATPSRSWTYEQDSPYYPGRSDLQARAGNPVHAAGPGGGLAGSLRTDVEYRLGAHWAVGAWLDIDRSAYYAPTQAMLYLRYALGAQSGPVPYPPSPLTPISQY